MNPLKVCAQFAAYAWYSEVRQGWATHKESSRFARANWSAFLPCAHEGLGRLLVRVAKAGKRAARGRKLRLPTDGAKERPIEGMAEAG